MQSESEKSRPPPFHYLRWLSAFLFLLSLGAMFYAGLLFNEMHGAEAREAVIREGVFPQEFQFSVSLLGAVGLAILAGLIYVGTALTERMMALR